MPGPPAAPQPAVGPDTGIKIAHPIQGTEQTPGGHDYREFVMTMCRDWVARFRPDANFDLLGKLADPHIATPRNAGTGGSIDVTARNVGETQITITGGKATYVLRVHVVNCPHPIHYHKLARGAPTDWITGVINPASFLS